MAREPTNIIVHAMNSVDGTPVDGEVIVDGVGTVGRTNTPFNFTFNTNSSLATGRITAQGYADAALTFRLSLPQLEVRAEPNSVEINTEAQITIYAIDSKTNASVTGQVVTNEAPNRIQRPIILGNTSEQITHTFVPARGDPVFEGDFVFFEPVYPTVTVVALGYSDTVVPIDFTGDLPSELLPPPFIPLPTPDGTEEDIPPDAVCLEAPCPDEVPEDEEVRDRPEP